MTKPTQDQIFQRLETLPDEIFDLLFSPKSSQINKKIFEKNHLPADKREIALELIGLILMGFMHPEDFVDEFQKESFLSREYCKALFNDINKEIFEPVKDILKKIYTGPMPARQEIALSQKEISKSPQPIYGEPPIKPPPKPIDLLKPQPQLIDLKEKEFKPTEPKSIFEIKPPQPLNKEKISIPPTPPPMPQAAPSSQLIPPMAKTILEEQKLEKQPSPPKAPLTPPQPFISKTTISQNIQHPPQPPSPPPKPVFIHKEETIEPIKKNINLNIPEPPKISEIKKPPLPPLKVQIEIGQTSPKIKTVNFFSEKAKESTSLQSSLPPPPSSSPPPPPPPSPPSPPQQ